MRYVYGGVQITFNWTIWKKANTVKEDFDQSELRVLLYGPADKYYIPVEITGNGDVAGQLPESLPAGVYSMKAFWTKEALRANGRVLESEQNCFIAITYNETEVESTSRDICLHLQSAISTYGKDGLSAYEIAVLLGQTQLKESEWSNVNVDLAEAEHERVLAEEARDTAEAGRVTAEQGRVSAETGRVSAEESRVAAEASRVEAESARVAAETARGTAETARENAEDLRELAETARGAAESSRRDAENARELAEQAREDAFDAHEAARQAVFETSEASRAQAFSTSESARTAAFNTTQAARQATFESSEEDRTTTFGISEAERAATFNQNENARAVAEAGRVSAEQGRVSAEQGRVSAEASRVSAEAGRVSAEASRVTAEEGRLNAEASRVTAEEAREAAEEIRQENYEETIKYIPQELTGLQQVKAKANLGLPNDTVFDVSKFNEYEGELHAYADLTAALEGLPAEYHVGGVSIKFINSVSGKYETWTLMDNSWSSDVADWQGVDEEPTAGSENLVKSGGIVSWGEDKYGKYVENPEFVRAVLDNKSKILEGIREDGTKVISGNLDVGGSAKILGEMEIAEVTYKVVESPEYLAAWADASDKVIFGLKADGKTYVGDADFLNEIKNNQEVISEINATIASISATVESLDIDALSSITAIENPEFIESKTDSEGKLLAGRTPDGTAFENVGFSTPHINVGGFAAEHTEDLENRIEVKTDADNKVVSYRDKEGVLHEIAGIETDVLKAGSFSLPEDTREEVKGIINTNVQPKKWYLPKFGSVNIKQETFYLDAGNWSSYENDVVLIQMYDDTAANASRRLTLSTYYIKNTLTPLPGGGYDRTSVNNSSVALELHAGKDVTAIGNKFFATAIYTPVMSGEYIVDYTKNKATKVLDPLSGDVIGYEYNGNSTEVKQVTDVPPYKAWKVNKNIEHYCIADIDFGTFYTKSGNAVSIKYQGSGSTQQRKRGLRITFYKNNTYAKKDKIKIGEMVRLSGFNMKSYGRSYSMVNDPVVSYVFIDIWNSRGKDAYPWNKDSVPFNGANGMIKSFPIETRLGGDFFGLQFFSLKKDEKNYMLDGDDDSSGIFVSGDVARSGWEDATPRDWADEMGADDRVVAYPDLEDSVSVETAAAMSELFKRTKGLVDESVYVGTDDNIYALSELTDVEGTLYVTDSLDDGAVVADSIAVTLTDFDISMLEEYIDIESWIDYYIGLQVFQLWDSTYHNVILHTRSDKKKFYMYYYDLDAVCEYAYDEDIIDICRTYWNYSMDFWEKFADTYKDSIINRYAELRKNVLSINNIRTIYDSYTDNIPNSVIEADVAKWNSGRPSNFLYTIEMLDNRLAWLDNNYFNL